MQKNKFLILLLTLIVTTLVFATIVNAKAPPLPGDDGPFKHVADGDTGSGNTGGGSSSSTPKPTKPNNYSCTNHTYIDGVCTKCGAIKPSSSPSTSTTKKCSNGAPVAGHTRTKNRAVQNSDGKTHTIYYTCNTCGEDFTITESCQLTPDKSKYISDKDGHCTIRKCPTCNREIADEATKTSHTYTGGYEKDDDTYHVRKCKVCEYADKQKHQLSNGTCTVCKYSEKHRYNKSGYCIDCGKRVEVTSGTLYSKSEKWDYVPNDDGITSWGGGTAVETIDGVWEESGSFTASWQSYTAHGTVWHNKVYEDMRYDYGEQTSPSDYIPQLNYGGAITGHGSVDGTFSEGGNTVTFNELPPGRIFVEVNGLGLSKRYVSGGGMGSDDYVPKNTVDPNNPGNTTDPSNPGNTTNPQQYYVTVKHVDSSTGAMMPGTQPYTVPMPTTERSLSLLGSLAGYVNNGATLDGSSTASSSAYRNSNKRYAESVQPNGRNRELIFYYCQPTRNTVTVKHVDADTGNLMLGTTVETKPLPLSRESSLTLSGPWEGYVNKRATLDGKTTSASQSAIGTRDVYRESVPDNGKNRELVFYYEQDKSSLSLTTMWLDVETNENIVPAEYYTIAKGSSAITMSKVGYITGMGYKQLNVKVIIDDSFVYFSNNPLEFYNVLAKRSGNFTISGLNIETSKDITIIFYYEKPKFTLRVEYQDEEGNPIQDPVEKFLPEEPTVETAPPEIGDYKFTESKKDDEEPKKDPNVPVGGEPQRDTVIVFVYEQKDPELTVEYQDEDGNEIADPKNNIPLPEDLTVEKAKEIPGYEFKESKKNDEDPTSNPEVPVGGRPRKDTVVVFVYKLAEEETKDSFADKEAQVFLKSNDRGEEEYNVEEAIPTSEDLYANVVASGFRLIGGNREEVTATTNVTVTYYQRYEGGIASYTVSSEPVSYKYWITSPVALYEIAYADVSNPVIGSTRIFPDLEKYGVTLIYKKGGTLNNIAGEKYLDGVVATQAEAEARVKAEAEKNRATDLANQVNQATVSMGTLGVTGKGLNGRYMVLNGEKVSLGASLTYTPSPLGSIPNIKEDVLYQYSNLHVNKEIANGTYETVGTVTYKLTRYKEVETPSQTETIPNIPGNVVKVHTPVVNNTSLNLTENNQYNQLADDTVKNAVVLGRAFTVCIPNNGQHKTYLGYGDRVYNYGGVTRDRNTTNPDKNHFAKAKKIKFDNVGVIYNNQYWEKGTKIPLTVSQENFTFIIPEWEKEAWHNQTVTMTTYVVAENCTNETLEEDGANLRPENYVATKVLTLRVIGEMADLQIRATNDPDWAKIKEVLPTDKMPLGQAGQNQISAYRYALKLGYSAYFDLKVVGSRGETSNTVNITPSYYYIEKRTDETPAEARKVDLYYHNSANERFVKLSTKSITLDMVMTNAYGTNFNPGFNAELSKALQVYTQKYSYTTRTTLGTSSEIVLNQAVRLPFVEAINAMKGKYNNNTPSEAENAIGHWYGSVRIPASTLAVEPGTNNVNANSSFLQNGYIAVVFDKVETKSGETPYLSYANGATNWPAEWKFITLPNGKRAHVPGGTAVLYEANIRANNDYETSGTH